MLRITGNQEGVFLRQCDFVEDYICRIREGFFRVYSLGSNPILLDLVYCRINKAFREMKLHPMKHLIVFLKNLVVVQRNDFTREQSSNVSTTAVSERREINADTRTFVSKTA